MHEPRQVTLSIENNCSLGVQRGYRIKNLKKKDFVEVTSSNVKIRYLNKTFYITYFRACAKLRIL